MSAIKWLAIIMTQKMRARNICKGILNYVFLKYAKWYGTLQSSLLPFSEAQKTLDRTSTQEPSVDNCGKKMRKPIIMTYAGEGK